MRVPPSRLALTTSPGGSTFTGCERRTRTRALEEGLHVLVVDEMRISRLRISNFRSIQGLEIDLPQICALVGPNNAGKSNLLLAIHRVLGRDWVTVSSFAEED